ncbi:LysR family transcriptional regulator [Sphingomonas sp. DBB INV C78]|uniref:LysR family transcriptional regulator n=1 Tax=Sphingomonas sp. DBB INV C78 TaxID=3349434 RepID=UPI0036D2DBEA
MQIRFLEYFVALARERHFARAAAACNVAQPTLSQGIASFEELLGKRLVVRNRRFIDLTAEGQAILPYARRLLADHDLLRQAADTATGALKGELRLGAIPAAMPAVGFLVNALRAKHPDLQLTLRSLTSQGIDRAMRDFELDVGITYLEDETPSDVRTVPLYSEEYVFATHAESEFGARQHIAWTEIVRQPLCLLHSGMQNRRILDAHLAKIGYSVSPVVTADSYIALLSSVAHGGLSSIITSSHAEFVGAHSHIRLIEIEPPRPQSAIGLVALGQEPLAPLIAAAIAAAQAARVQIELERT